MMSHDVSASGLPRRCNQHRQVTFPLTANG